MTWIKEVEKYINDFRDFEPADRLDYLAGIKKCNQAFAYVVNGWEFMVGNEEFTVALSGDDLKSFYEAWRLLALLALRHDITWKKQIIENTRKTESAYIA